MTVITSGLRYLKEGVTPHMWCPGCGNGIVLNALLRAFEELAYKNEETVVATGIGCWGKADDYVVTNGFHGTHGRALAFATGMKAFNPRLNVVVLMGDGDCITIGGNHFIHAARRNIDVTAIVVNNFNFGMTGGQVSGTTPFGMFTSTTTYANPERDFDICALADVAGANYVARGTPWHGFELEENIKEALNKRGFSVVEVFSPCPTHYGKYNKMGTPVEMLKRIREMALPKEEYARLDPAQKEAYFPIGKLVDRDDPDFNARYDEVRSRAMKG
ncbi:MAG: 2-oxoacid:ferredoxin oxidoreductase subunit beta [Deltaproteobacteria bacterium]|nr:2-oxoacid:ferredoxin oxidoreductase subunit beta [Deltaproteobacteria bacterium]